MDRLLQTVRHALRSLWRHRGLSFFAVLCMGLGIGTCVTLFTSVNSWLFRPLPYDEPDRLVGLRETTPREGGGWRGRSLSGPDYLDWQERARTVSAMGALRRVEYNLSADGEAERVLGARITASLFPLLGCRPELGRGFTAQDDRPGSEAVLIGHALWQRRFGQDPAVLGRALRLDGVQHTVVGVMPEGFGFPEYAEVWGPMGLVAGTDRDQHSLEVIGRLAPGSTVAQAQAELTAVAAALEEEHPDTNKGHGALVQPYINGLTPPGVVMGMYLLLASGLFVQLIASANVANLLLAKANAQRQEIAVRLALGAGRGRVLRQFLVETLLLTGAGGLLGLMAASVGAVWLAGLTPIKPPYWVTFDVDSRVVGFTLAVSAASALLVGLVPAWQAGRAGLMDDLKEGGRTLASGARARLARILVVSELAVALVLLIGAALMMQSFQRRYQTNPGVDSRGVLTARVSLAGEAYREPEQRAVFLEELLRRLRALPEVAEAGAASSLPFRDPLGDSGRTRPFEIEGHPVEPGKAPTVALVSVVAGHLPAAGIPIRSGRAFSREEEAEGREVAVVSESLAQRYWSGADPVGQRLRLADGPWLRVVGVAQEVSDAGDMAQAFEATRGQVYVPYRRDATRTVALAVRTRVDPAQLAGSLRATVRSLDPGLAVHTVLTLDEVRARSAWIADMWGRTLSQVALLALALAALGVYGIVSYSVSQRTHEIGIRMAVGAARGQVLRLVLGDGLRLALRAVALGLAGAFLLMRSLSGFLYGVGALDPPTFLGCAGALLLAALVASYAPAWRGTRVDPVVALRSE